MNFFRRYISPFLILAMFILALLAVSSRAFLDSDMAAPAPIAGDELGLLENQLLSSKVAINSFSEFEVNLFGVLN